MASDGGYTQLRLNGLNADVVLTVGEQPGTGIGSEGWSFFSDRISRRGGLARQLHGMFSDVPYTLADFASDNALVLGSGTAEGQDRGTITFDSPVKARTLWLLLTSAGGRADVAVTVGYEDGTCDEPVVVSVDDWQRDTYEGAALWQIGRRNASATDDNCKTALYERAVTVARQDQKIMSVTLELKTSNGPQVAVLAASATDKDSPTSLKEKKLFFISDSHLDTQWNWTVKTTISDYLKKTLEQNFARFDDPQSKNFEFNFEGAIKYQWAKEYYPDLYARLKDYVRQGRWNIAGGAVDANDVNIGSAESLMRNFLYGQTFYREEFGVRGGYDVMLPDCFGFPWSLPTVAAHCGMKYFHSQKLSWNSAYAYSRLPRFARWRGTDGEELLSVLKLNPYDDHEVFRKDMSADEGMENEIDENARKYGIPATIKYVGPRGDRGGGLDKETADWLSSSVDSEGPLGVSMHSSTDMLGQLFGMGYDRLPVIDHGLPMRAHGVGGYTSRCMLKFWNRKGELLGGAAEKASVAADWLGALGYQKATLRSAWTRLLWHQFHDDIPGTCINEAYTFSVNDGVLNQLDFGRTLNNAVGAVARCIDTRACTDVPLVVYNPLSIERTDIVEAEIDLPQSAQSVVVTDPDGHTVKSQIIGRDGTKARVLFLATVPSLGYAAYNLAPSEKSETSDPALSVSEMGMENIRYRVAIDANGDVCSVVDKSQGGKELLSGPIRLAMLFDESTTWPSWEIHGDQLQRAPREYVDKEGLSVEVAERGPLRVSLKVTRTKQGSTFVQYIRLAGEGSSDRIDFANEVNWQTRERLLKATFPLTASSPEATYDLSIGADVNKNSTDYSTDSNNTDALCEFLGHRWADVTDRSGQFGVSILNDSKYGWDKQKDNEIRLTLIHTPKVGTNYAYEGKQDLGLNRFTYSFFAHTGRWGASTQWEADRLNEPMLAYRTTAHSGSLGKSFGFVDVDNQNVAVKALKKAEASDKTVVRFYELTGEGQDVTATFPADIISAEEVNGVEESVGPASFSSRKLKFHIDRFHPKTFALTLATPSLTVEETAAPQSEAVALDYNIDVMSGNDNRPDAATPKAYPSELVGQNITADGIVFKTGGKADGQNNAVSCKGQTVSLPAMSNGRKVYVLAASLADKGSTATFNLGARDTTLHISHYGGYVGVWSNSPDVKKVYRMENTAFTATHSHVVKDVKDGVYDYLYMYKYALTVPEGTSSITLPDNPDVLVFSVTLSDNTNDDTSPVSDVVQVLRHKDTEDTYKEIVHDDPIIIPQTVRASGQTNDSEGAVMASDGDLTTKWCDNSSRFKWIEYRFNREMAVTGWRVTNAGTEGDDMIARAYRLQRLVEGGWVDVESIADNDVNTTDRVLESPFTAKGIRLFVERGEQNGTTARVYEFAVYGHEASDADRAVPQIVNRRPAYGVGRQTANVVSSSGRVNAGEDAYNLLDSDPSTKWCYNGNSSRPSAVIDLTDVYDVSRFDIYDSRTREDYANSDFYDIAVSTDGKNFASVVSASGVSDEDVHTARLDKPVSARYVRLTMGKGGSGAVRVYAFDIWGTYSKQGDADPSGNVGLHAAVLGSNLVKNFKETALCLTDGKTDESSLAWNSDNQGTGTINWAVLDLGQRCSMERFVLHDAGSNGKEPNISRYRLYVSDTAPTDEQMAQYDRKSSGTDPGWQRVANERNTDDVKTFVPEETVMGRYVKIEVPYTAVTDSALLYELEIYGHRITSSVDKVEAGSPVRIFPTVVENGSCINVVSPSEALCLLTTTSGQTVWSGTVPSEGRIPTAKLSPGVYLVRVVADGRTTVKKIVVKE